MRTRRSIRNMPRSCHAMHLWQRRESKMLPKTIAAQHRAVVATSRAGFSRACSTTWFIKINCKRLRSCFRKQPPSVRNQITAELVRYYESKKDFTHAEALLSTLADSDRYPFGVAASLLTALGQEHSADRISIFNQALNNFENHSTEASFGGDDIGTSSSTHGTTFLRRWRWRRFSKTLEAAKEANSPSHYSMTSAKGSVVLNSNYALRLFQLLPILQELDKDKADALLRDQTEVADQLRTYPRGMQSLQSEKTSFSYGVTDGGSGYSWRRCPTAD